METALSLPSPSQILWLRFYYRRVVVEINELKQKRNDSHSLKINITVLVFMQSLCLLFDGN